MEVVSGDNWTTGAISRAKLQSNHHQQTSIQFFTGWMPFLSPNQQRKSTERAKYLGLHLTVQRSEFDLKTC